MTGIQKRVQTVDPPKKKQQAPAKKAWKRPKPMDATTLFLKALQTTGKDLKPLANAFLQSFGVRVTQSGGIEPTIYQEARDAGRRTMSGPFLSVSGMKVNLKTQQGHKQPKTQK